MTIPNDTLTIREYSVTLTLQPRSQRTRDDDYKLTCFHNEKELGYSFISVYPSAADEKVKIFAMLEAESLVKRLTTRKEPAILKELKENFGNDVSSKPTTTTTVNTVTHEVIQSS